MYNISHRTRRLGGVLVSMLFFSLVYNGFDRTVALDKKTLIEVADSPLSTQH